MDPSTQQPENTNTPADLPEIPLVNETPLATEPTAPAPSPAVEEVTVATPQAPITTGVMDAVLPAAAVAASTTTAFNQFQQDGTPNQSPVQASGAPKRNNLIKIISIVLGSLVLLGGAVAAFIYFVYIPSLTRVSDSDLVSTTTGNTTYLRPKQWKAVSINGIDGFGDQLAKDNKSTAAIFINKTAFVKTGVKDISSDSLADFRSSIMSQGEESNSIEEMKAAFSCNEIDDFKKESSTTSTAKSVGLIKISVICKKDGDTFKAISYILLGQDGYARNVLFMASNPSWTQNEAVFNKMIESADQE